MLLVDTNVWLAAADCAATGATPVRVAAVTVVATVATTQHSRNSGSKKPASKSAASRKAAPKKKTASKASTPRNSKASKSASRKAPARKPASRSKATPPPPPRRESAFLGLLRHHWADVWGITFVVFGLVSGLAIYFEAAGPLGELIRNGFGALLGWARIVVPFALVVIGIALIRGRTGETNDTTNPQEHLIRLGIGGVLAFIATTGMLHLTRGFPSVGDPLEAFADAGGYSGWLTGAPLRAVLGPIAAGVILVAVGLVGVLILTAVSMNRWFRRTSERSEPVTTMLRGWWASLLGPELIDINRQPNDAAIRTVDGHAIPITPQPRTQPRTAPIKVGGETVAVFESEQQMLLDGNGDRGKGGKLKLDEPVLDQDVGQVDPLIPAKAKAKTAPAPLPNDQDAEPFAAKAPVEAKPDEPKKSEAKKPEPKPSTPSVVVPEVPQPRAEIVDSGPGRQLAIDLGPAVKGTKWKLPKMALLSGGDKADVDKTAVEEAGRTLERALAAHGVDASLVGMVVGPTVTRFELELGEGVKVAKITSLNKDIAYAMASADVRILAPIPGRQAIGVEVPNTNRQIVALGDLLRSAEARKATGPLEVAVGRDINGKAKLMDLAKMPHLLIAGATGSGKSSCINSIVTSILMRTTPDKVRMILIDPKMVEMTQYERVPHLLTQPVTDPKKAANALSWACREMDRRYELLSKCGFRDIGGYNKAYDKNDLPPGPIDENGDGTNYPRLPFIMIVVDELADLMMVAARDVEDSICRIAQKARAVGIHLVIATQRPSTNVITGVIKANVPARLAFSVSSLTDSRVILDQPGAERLVGRGDMLLLDSNSSVANRIQGCWVTEEEVKDVVSAWRKQVKDVDEAAEVTADSIVETASTSGGGGGNGGADDDELFEQAKQLVVTSQLGSTSMLQRKLRVGFARAGRLMDILEENGIVGPSVGSKAREVLISAEDL